MLPDFNFLPIRDWQKFERFCHALFSAEWADPTAQLNGRSGQAQSGVDVFGRPDQGEAYAGVQCKRRDPEHTGDGVTESELRQAVAEARTFKPDIRHSFVLATTSPRDAKIQETARIITVEHAALGLFPVYVYSWDDLELLLNKHPQIVVDFYQPIITKVLGAYASSARGLPPSLASALPSHVAAGFGLDVLRAEFGAELDSVRARFAAGQVSVAFEQIQELRGRIWNAADPATRVRISGLSGLIQLELGNETAAASDLLLAVSQDSESTQAWGYAALAYSIRGDKQTASNWAKRALGRDPSNVLAAQVRILSDETPDAPLLEELEQFLGKRPELYSSLAQRAIARHDLIAARRWSESALQLGTDKDPAKATLAEITVWELAERNEQSGNLTAQEERELSAAGDLLEALWVKQEPALQTSRWGWLRSATVAAMLLRHASALDRSAKLLPASGNAYEAFALRAQILVRHDQLTLARELLSTREDLDASATALLAIVLAKQGDVTAAITNWSLLLKEADLPLELRYDIERNYVIALLGEGELDRAVSFTHALLAVHPEDAARLLNAARVSEKTGALEDVQRLLDRAEHLDSTRTSVHWNLRLANLLARHERYDAAILRYSSVIDTTTDSTDTRTYVELLVDAQRFKAALEVTDRLKGTSTFYLAMHCTVQERLGNVDDVIALCEAHLASDPADMQIRLRLALQLARKGERSRVRQELSHVTTDWSSRNFDFAVIHAQLLTLLGEAGSALEVLYQARARNPDLPEAHLTYIGQYTALKDREAEPQQAELNTAAQLEGVGAPGWILLSSAREESLEGKAYPAEHPLSQAVRGKSKGDSVSFEASGQTWLVKDLATKYAFAFIESGKLFPSRFPSSGGFRQYEIAPAREDFVQQMRELVAPGHSRHELVMSMYAQGTGCVGSVAKALNKNVVEAFSLIVTAPYGLLAFSNSREERADSAKLLAHERPTLTIDPSSILVLDGLDLLRAEVSATCDLIVAQSTIDEFEQVTLEWKSMRREGARSLGLDNNQLVYHERSADDVERTASHFESLVAFLRTRCRVRGVSPEIAEKTRLEPELRAAVGNAFVDTALVAMDTGTMMSDDFRFRYIALGKLGVRSVGSVSLLLELANRGALPRSAYNDACAKLLELKYRTVSTSADTLLAAVRLDRWSPGRYFTAVARSLEGPTVEEGSALAVAARFVRELSFTQILDQVRAALIFALLDALIVGRDPRQVAKAFEALVEQALHLHPLAAREVAGVIAGWRAQRALRL
jgi:tetratricopeptide (TPR) repeat protein